MNSDIYYLINYLWLENKGSLHTASPSSHDSIAVTILIAGAELGKEDHSNRILKYTRILLNKDFLIDLDFLTKQKQLILHFCIFLLTKLGHPTCSSNLVTLKQMAINPIQNPDKNDMSNINSGHLNYKHPESIKP